MSKINGIDVGNIDVFDFTEDDLDPSYYYVKLSDMLNLISEKYLPVEVEDE